MASLHLSLTPISSARRSQLSVAIRNGACQASRHGADRRVTRRSADHVDTNSGSHPRPVLWRRIREIWRDNKGLLVWSGLLSLAAYLLVLIAMRVTQVSYVATLRESSVIFGAILGWRVLGDPLGRQRVVASIIVTLGLILLATAMHG